jgi:hypothetical protein
MNFDGKKALVERVQAALGLAVDGDDGPKTWAGIVGELAPAKDAPANALEAYSRALVDVALSQVGVREQTSNRAPEISKYWTATWYPDGAQNREPWCAAFVCWCVAEAAKKVPVNFRLPQDPRAFGLDEDWAKHSGLAKSGSPSARDIKTGDIVVFQFSHVGICVGSNGDSIFTVEGNTNGDGSREGDGVYRKTRSASLIRSAIHLT